MKVVALFGSPRANGNTATLAKIFKYHPPGVDGVKIEVYRKSLW